MILSFHGCPEPFRVGKGETTGSPDPLWVGTLCALANRWLPQTIPHRRPPPPPVGGETRASDPIPTSSSQTILNRRPPPTPVGGGWPKAGWGSSESSKRIRGPQALGKRVVIGPAAPSTVPSPAPLGHPPPEWEFWGRVSIEGNGKLRCPDPFRVGIHQLPIVALSELASGRVANGREGPPTTQFESTANLVPTLKGSGHPRFIPAPPVEKRPQEGAP